MIAANNMSNACKEEEFEQLKRGPWTFEEDNLLINHINFHGEGRWNSLAKSAGLKRTGKSCRLRWLNYLKPDIKRGNLTPHEQLMIHELHLKWGNRWSKIACQLPGRTDNEIKNYWRTRVEKHARHLKIDSSSKRFVEALQRFWMPRLLEKVEQTSSSSSSSSTSTSSTLTIDTDHEKLSPHYPQAKQDIFTIPSPTHPSNKEYNKSSSNTCGKMLPLLPEMSQLYGDSTVYYNLSIQNIDSYNLHINEFDMMEFCQPDDMASIYFQVADTYGTSSGNMATDAYWNMDDLW